MSQEQLPPPGGAPAAAGPETPVLVQRLTASEAASPHPSAEAAAVPPPAPWRLPLTADQRGSLRGHRRSACGRDLVLQLPRGPALQPGDTLLSADGRLAVRVEAAPEPVMVVRSADPLALLQAAYHLGNRHVAMELHVDRLLLLQDSVLAELLRQRGLAVQCCEAPFQPEAGAYAALGHGSAHGHHDHGHHAYGDHTHSHHAHSPEHP